MTNVLLATSSSSSAHSLNHDHLSNYLSLRNWDYNTLTKTEETIDEASSYSLSLVSHLLTYVSMLCCLLVTVFSSSFGLYRAF